MLIPGPVLSSKRSWKPLYRAKLACSASKASLQFFSKEPAFSINLETAMATNDHREVDEEVAQTQQVHLEEEGGGNVARGAEEG